MSKVAFILDSSSGIKNLEYPDVYVLPLIVSIKSQDGKIKALKDGVDITPLEVCKLLDENKYEIKTSQASMGEIINLVESIYDQYDRIYVHPILQKISGSYQTWKVVAEDYPKLLVFPQTDITIGMRWTVEDLLSMKKNGSLNDQSYLEYMENIHKRRHGLLYVYNLTQLARGGRVSNFKSIMANLFGLKIIITADQRGLTFYKTAKSCDKLVDLSLKECQEKEAQFDVKNIDRVGFIFSPTYPDDKNAKEVFDIFKKHLPEKYRTYQEPMSAVILAHTGAKCFAIYLETSK